PPPRHPLFPYTTLFRSLMARGTLAHTGEHGAVGRAYLQQPDLMQKLLAAPALQLVPQLVRAQRERNVIGMLVIRLADDPRAAVRSEEHTSELQSRENLV